MSAKGRALWIVLAIVAIFASSPAFASIPRSTILDAPSIGFRDLEIVDYTSTINEAIDNAALLHHAIDAALIAPAPVESLSETRVWVSRLERPLFVEPVPLLSDGLQKASADVWPEIASGPTVLTPDPMGYRDSSNLYAFGAGDPVNNRDPRGTNAVSMAGIFVGTDANGNIKKVDYRKYYGGDTGALYRKLAADNVPMHLRDLIVERVTGTNQGTAVVAALAPQVNARLASYARHSTSTGLSSAPVIGDLKDAQEVVTGRDLITGEKLTRFDRGVTLVAAGVPIVGGKVLREALREVGDGVRIISGSDLRHLNGAIAESHGWAQALEGGHRGIQAPDKVTAPGVDFVTYDPAGLGDVVIWDSKYRADGAFPATIPAHKIAKWTKEATEAIEALPPGPLKDAALEAINAGRVRPEIFKWPQ